MSNNKKNAKLYNKFNVTRTDGKSEPGMKHDRCEYFVLDLTHDPLAVPAIQAYSVAARNAGYIALADDLDAKSPPKTTNLTFPDVLEAMMANPNQRWMCDALDGKSMYYASGYFWVREGVETAKFRLTAAPVISTDWRMVEERAR